MRSAPGFRTRATALLWDRSQRVPRRSVGGFLSEHPTVQLHFAPTYSSWLNQVELWFAKIARGVFTSVADLKSKLMRYIRQYNKNRRVVKWHYADRSRHVGA